MQSRSRVLLGVAPAVVLLVALAPPVAAQADPAVAPDRSVEVTVRLGQLDGDRRVDVKSYEIVVLSGGVGSRLLSGARIPLPTGGDGSAGPAIVYQNVGFSSEVRAWILGDGRIKLAAAIEDSRVVDAEGGGQPRVETRQLDVHTVVSPGTPVEVTRVRGLLDKSGFVELEATILE